MTQQRRFRSFPPSLREPCSFCSKPRIPVIAVGVFFVRQKRSGVHVPFGLLSERRLRTVDHGYQPVPVVPDISDHVVYLSVVYLINGWEVSHEEAATGFVDRAALVVVSIRRSTCQSTLSNGLINAETTWNQYIRVHEEAHAVR